MSVVDERGPDDVQCWWCEELTPIDDATFTLDSETGSLIVTCYTCRHRLESNEPFPE